MKKISTPNFWNKKNHFLTFLFIPISWIYYLVTLGNKFRKIFAKNKKIKIICVGNLYLGGTGKTPLVKKIYERINDKKKCCIIKKYRHAQIDEINFLKENANIITPKSRLKGLNEAENKGFSVAILDDGIQDYTFKKDISILCVKSNKGFGNEKILPAGPLRETLANIKNYNFALINGDKNNELNKIIEKYNPSIKIFYSYYKIKNKSKFQGGKFLAFSGIADNKSFFDLLYKNNINILDSKSFTDHYNFKKKDIEQLIKISEEKNIDLITTEKNYNNISEKFKKKIYYVKLDLIIENEDELINEINKILF